MTVATWNASVPRAWAASIIAGVVTFVLIGLPVAAIQAAAATGSVGSIGATRLGILAGLTNLVLAVGSGAMVYRARRAGMRPGALWSTWFIGLVVAVVGTWLVPLIMVFTMVDSDHSLAERGWLIALVWVVAYAIVAAVALFPTRHLWRAR